MSGELQVGGITLSCANGYVQSLSRKSKKEKKRRKLQQKRKLHKARKALWRSRRGEVTESDDDAVLEDYISNILQDSAGAEVKKAEESGLDDYSDLLQAPVPAFAIGEDLQQTDEDAVYSSENDSLADSEGSQDEIDNLSISDIAEDLADKLILQAVAAECSSGELSPSDLQVVADTKGRKRNSKQVSFASLPDESSSSDESRGRATAKQVKKRQKRLRKEREERQGLDLDSVNRQLHDFVVQERDMEMLPSMLKANVKPVQRLAAMYNVQASPCQSRRNRHYIMIRATRRMRLPEASEVTIRIATLLAEAEGLQPGKNNAGPGRGPRQSVKKDKRLAEVQEGSGRKYQQPTLFVPSGHLNDTEPDGVITVKSVAEIRQGSSGSGAQAIGSQVFQVQPDGPGAAEPLEEGELPATGLGFSDPSRWSEATAVLEQSYAEPAESFPPGLSPGSSGNVLQGTPHSMQSGVRSASEVGKAASDPSNDGLGQEAYFKLLEEKIKPSILRTKAQCKKARKKLEKEQRRTARQGFEEQPTKPQQLGPQFGEFERHTTGIGSRLLAQMGFKGLGTGLGRDSQGIAEPLKAISRPKKLGLGA